MEQHLKQLTKKQLKKMVTWTRRELPITKLYNFILCGNYERDEERIDLVRRLVKESGGEFEFNYAHKANLYRFEIGGRFENEEKAAQFAANWQSGQPTAVVATPACVKCGYRDDGNRESTHKAGAGTE